MDLIVSGRLPGFCFLMSGGWRISVSVTSLKTSLSPGSVDDIEIEVVSLMLFCLCVMAAAVIFVCNSSTWLFKFFIWA